MAVKGKADVARPQPPTIGLIPAIPAPPPPPPIDMAAVGNIAHGNPMIAVKERDISGLLCFYGSACTGAMMVGLYLTRNSFGVGAGLGVGLLLCIADYVRLARKKNQ